MEACWLRQGCVTLAWDTGQFSIGRLTHGLLSQPDRSSHRLSCFECHGLRRCGLRVFMDWSPPPPDVTQETCCQAQGSLRAGPQRGYPFKGSV